MHKKPYRDLNTYFRTLFGCRVHKVTVDAGLSCPNRDGTLSTGGCIYCNTKGSGTGAHLQDLSITQQIERSKDRIARRFKTNKLMAYFQSFTNTYAPIAHLKALYDEALAIENVVGLAIGTRPDCVDTAVLDLLESYTSDHLIWIEYGLQSAHDRTLSLINRGHDFACFEKAVAATQRRGINICAHVILGLPGETRQDMLETADAVADMGIEGIKLHLLYVVRGTPMETLYRDGRYRCLEQYEYADLVCAFIERLPDTMIIQRLTGDPHPDELMAPAWSLQKKETLDLIHIIFEEKNTWQGKRFGPKASG
ncbi:MAG: TIGR01212 family radical SAM protein [Desulfosarcina sp.]|nr:TIGR01212 family radical SAM protein [Desulfosarcina sp.]MBC2742341.1 TIGR01212 family radical SAM protein [Desulfosarcina sp.]MBC2765252.1 TIGR01212 family radical SAM protein [Desulfosarcina sp.]